MNRVYAWFPGRGNAGPAAGHASLDIAVGEGPGRAEYVGWWPAEPARAWAGTGCRSAGPNGYADDVAALGREPDEAVEVDCLDEDGMRERWLELAWAGDYRLLFRNCAHTVADVLMAGGGRLSPACVGYAARRVFWKPGEALILARLVNAEAGVIRRGRGEGFEAAPRLLALDGREAW